MPSSLIAEVQAVLRSVPRPVLPERCRDYIALAATLLERGLVREAEAVVAAVRQAVRQARCFRSSDTRAMTLLQTPDPKNAQARFKAFLGGESRAAARGVSADGTNATRGGGVQDASRGRDAEDRAGLHSFRIHATLRG